MTRYCPIFSDIVDSSIWDEEDFVVKVFITMLAKMDRDFVVRGTAYNISKWSRKTEIEVLNALKILSSPDKKRLEPQPHEGRRIEKTQDGYWLILNGKKYQEEMQRINRREYQRQWAESRRNKKSTPSPLERAYEKAAMDGNEALCDELAASGIPDPPKTLQELNESQDVKL